MEEKRNQPWGTRPAAYNSSKVEPANKCDLRDFDKLFEDLQVTKEDQRAAAPAGTGGAATTHEKEKQHMNMNMDGINGSKNPFDDSPPPTATRRHDNDDSERNYNHPRPDEEAAASPSTKLTRTRTLCSSFVEVVMRLTVVVLLLLAFILIASDSKTTKVGYVLGQVTLKFTYFDAFKYLLSASMIACGFSVIQLVPELYRMHTGEVLIPEEIILYFNFICDQFLAYLLLSSTSAGMTASNLVRKGYDVVWLSLCNGTGFWSFCAQAAASVSMAFLAFLITASLALLSGYRLAKYLVFA